MGYGFYVIGIFMVLYFKSFYVLIVYFNYCYFEVGFVWWFGGGIDLIFYYFYVEDVVYFY